MTDRDQMTLAECSIAAAVTSIERDCCRFDQHNWNIPLAVLPADIKKKLQPGQAVRISFAIESPNTRDQWSVAYARQGKSDLDAYRILRQAFLDNRLPVCHSLHYLQMAAEKIAKAHELGKAGSNKSLDTLTTRHTGASIEEFVKTVFKQVRGPALIKAKKTEQLATLMSKIGTLARQLEKCQPAVDKKISPQNVEYPWEDSSRISVPCEQRFFIDEFEPSIWDEFMQILEGAATDITDITKRAA